MAATAALALAGCASFSADGGMSRVSRLTQERTGHPVAFQRDPQDADAARSRVADLLKTPLTADGAIEMALLNNRMLQQQLGNVGVSEADLVQAGRLRNPAISLGRLAGGGALEIDRSVMFDVLGLLTLPSRSRIAQGRFDQAQLQAASDAVAVAQQARQAYVDAVAARQLEAYARQVMEAADAADEVAKGMLRAGNASKLDQMREQAFHADATAQVARSHQQALSARERLVRALGLGDEQAQLQLPDRLPDLPGDVAEPQDAERAALDKRLDVLMARRDAESTASQLGLTRATGFIDVLDAGWQNKSQRGAPQERGGQVQFELPIFDFGGAGRARAEAVYMQAVNRAAATAVNARSEVREAYAGYRSAFELARHYRDEVVPLHRRISEETVLRYNGMLVDVFELLADAREQIASVTASVEATRDFWLADSRLQEALAGAGATPASSASSISR
ncbi:MAG: TolC family protein [Burkholderiales bacterium]|nr:TolC family protein [Burkholderiales bacterium]